MRIVSKIIEKGQRALQDLNLLKILQSEITHELSSNHFQDIETGGLGDFAVEWDSAESRDLVLRRKLESGEEVVVSALLGPLSFDEETEQDLIPRDVSVKICVEKPGLSSALQFDCQVYHKGHNRSEFSVHNASYLRSLTPQTKPIYRGPLFSNLDPRLQEAFKDYLVAKGIGENLTNFLLLYLRKKEQDQYVNWLKKLQSSVTEV